jgi:hypothetical protein
MALINGIKPFWIWLRFRRENRDNRVQSSDLRPQKPIPRSHWDCWNRFRGLNETAESVSAVSMRPRNRFPRSQWDRGNFMTSRESSQKPILAPIPIKGNHRKNQYICKHCIPIVNRKRHYYRGTLTKNFRVRGLIETAESDFGDFVETSYHRFSRRIRSHMQNGFRPWIRALGGIVWWKKPRVKNLVTLSL